MKTNKNQVKISMAASVKSESEDGLVFSYFLSLRAKKVNVKCIRSILFAFVFLSIDYRRAGNCLLFGRDKARLGGPRDGRASW